MSLRPTTCLLLTTAALLAGCKDRQVTAYRAPKDSPPPAMAKAAGAGGLPADHPPIGPAAGGAGGAGSDMASTPVPTAAGGLTWTAPSGWAPKPLGSMRKGSFSIKGDGGAEADLSITAFPGATGGLEANLNRWRGQVGLPPQSDSEVTAAVEKFTSNGLEFLVADYAGGGNRLIGAIVPYQGNSWFFKLMGPDALVAGQKDT
ncbi:MAG TPA: hypothetical protein VG734_24230, partial [Lacunisphaera sp.]|nr:hypothetical protein [Lacunisphaera sp.]